MEGSEGALNRVGRAAWTVWGYLTGAVRRYLRPEEAQNVHQQEDTVPISYAELKIKEEEEEEKPQIEKSERKMSEDLQRCGNVQAAAAPWDRGNVADRHEDRKSQMKENNETTLENTNNAEPDGEEGVNEMMRIQNEALEKLIESACVGEPSLTDLEESALDVKREEHSQGSDKEGVGTIMNIITIKRDDSECEEEPIKLKYIGQSLLTETVDVNAECRGNTQEQRGEPVRGEDEETKEDLIQNRFADKGLLTNDLHVEKDENNKEQKMKSQGEEDQTLWRNHDETEEDLINSELTDQDLVAKEANLHMRNSERGQEQNHVEGLAQDADVHVSETNQETPTGGAIMNRDKHEPNVSGFPELTFLTKEDDVNVSSKQNGEKMVQTNKQEEEERGVDELIAGKRVKQETRKAGPNVEWTENHQDRIVKDADVLLWDSPLGPKLIETFDSRIETNQDQTKKTEDEEEEEIIQKTNYDAGDVPVKSDQDSVTEETDMNDKTNQEQRRDQEGQCEIMNREYGASKEITTKTKFTDHIRLATEATVIGEKSETAQQQKRTVKVEERIDEIMRVENDEETFETDLNGQRSGSSQEQRGNNKKDGVDSMGRENDEAENEPLKGKWTGQDVDPGNKDSVCDLGDIAVYHVASMDKIMESVDENEPNFVEPRKCATTEYGDMEDEASSVQPVPTWEHPLNQSLQTLLEMRENTVLQNVTPELAPSVDSGQPVDKAHDGSQRQAVMTKQEFECENMREKTGTGNQAEAAETTSQLGAEVAAVYLKKSAERGNSLHEPPVVSEYVAVQELTGQWLFKQEPKLKQSADSKMNEHASCEEPFSKIRSVSLEQTKTTAVMSLDAESSSSVQKLCEGDGEAEIDVCAKLSSSQHSAEEFEMISKVIGMSEQTQAKRGPPPIDQTPLEDRIDQTRSTGQYSASSLSKALLDTESEQKTMDLQTESQKYIEKQERTVSADTASLDENKNVNTCLGVGEKITSILTTESEDADWEPLERKEVPKRNGRTHEPQSHEETLESRTDMQLQNAARECLTHSAVEPTVVSTWKVMESVEKPIYIEGEEEAAKCHVVFSESECEEKVGNVKSVADSNAGVEERGRSVLKREFGKISGYRDTSDPSVLTDLLPPSQDSSLDFTVQKSKIAVKNPLIRPPKDPRTLINMASVEPLTPQPSRPSFLKKSQVDDASVPGKGVVGFRLPGLDAGFPALRKTDAGGKTRHVEDSESSTTPKSDPGLQGANDNVKQETSPPKPKWTPPRQLGMASPLMMAELKSKLRKPAKE